MICNATKRCRNQYLLTNELHHEWFYAERVLFSLSFRYEARNMIVDVLILTFPSLSPY